MKKILTSFMVAALATASIASSLAYTFTVTPLSNPPDFTFPGVTTNAGLFTATLAPFPADTLTPPPGAPGSGYSAFIIQTTPTFVAPPPPPQVSDTFNATTSYFFDISVNGSATHTFRVDGTVQGDVSLDSPAPGVFVGGSNAFFTSTRVTDLNTGATSTLFAVSPDAKDSLLLSNITFSNGFTGKVYVDFRQRITPPLGNPASIGGFFGADVPEPGTVGLLIGSGIGGLLFFRRRRA